MEIKLNNLKIPKNLRKYFFPEPSAFTAPRGRLGGPVRRA